MWSFAVSVNSGDEGISGDYVRSDQLYGDRPVFIKAGGMVRHSHDFALLLVVRSCCCVNLPCVSITNWILALLKGTFATTRREKCWHRRLLVSLANGKHSESHTDSLELCTAFTYKDLKRPNTRYMCHQISFVGFKWPQAFWIPMTGLDRRLVLHWCDDKVKASGLRHLETLESSNSIVSRRGTSFSSTTTWHVGGRPGFPMSCHTSSPIPSRKVAPEVGAKALSVLARSPVGWDEVGCGSLVLWCFCGLDMWEFPKMGGYPIMNGL